MGDNIESNGRILVMYRMTVASIIGFSLFSLFHLIKEIQIREITSIILWLITIWIIFSEWWNVEDNYLSHKSQDFLLVVPNLLYLLALVLLPVSLIIGIPTTKSLSLYFGALLVLSLLDIPISYFHHKSKRISGPDTKLYKAYMWFDIILVLIYGVAYFILDNIEGLTINLPDYVPFSWWHTPEFPLLSWQIVVLIIIYAVDFSFDWFLVPEFSK